MDQEEIKNKIMERYNNLQPEIQNAITDSNYQKNLYDIAQKHKLSIEQMGDLEINTTLVMLGDTHPDKYKEELIDDLELPEEKINEIINDVNEKVLNPIRELIKKNFEEDEKEDQEISEVPPPPYEENISKKEDIHTVEPTKTIPISSPKKEEETLNALKSKLDENPVDTNEEKEEKDYSVLRVNKYREPTPLETGKVTFSQTPVVTPPAPVVPTVFKPSISSNSHDPYREEF